MSNEKDPANAGSFSMCAGKDSRLTGAVQASYRARFAPRDILSLFKSSTQAIRLLRRKQKIPKGIFCLVQRSKGH